MIESYWKLYLWNKLKEISNKVEFLKKENGNFNAYQNNGGTVISISGNNFCIIASDTRFSTGFSIPTRFQTRVIKISKKIILATSGMLADIRTFQRQIKNNMSQFKNSNKGIISINNCAYYLSSALYSRRFFPYYTFNILSGLDDTDKGSVYNFDAVGSFEKMKFSCTGSGQLLLQPLLDGHFNENQEIFLLNIKSITNMISVIKQFFIKISKRNIYIGDGLQFFIVNKKGIIYENYILKFD
jgi:20S proteasome subunit beta 6